MTAFRGFASLAWRISSIYDKCFRNSEVLLLGFKYTPSQPLSRSAPAAEVWAEGDEREDFEQHLRADHRGVGGGVVLGGYLDDVAADDVEAFEAVQDRLGLAWGQAAGLGGCWCRAQNPRLCDSSARSGRGARASQPRVP
jgi:hypothetical protein